MAKKKSVKAPITIDADPMAIVKMSKQRESAVMDEFVNAIGNPMFGGFAAQMAVQSLIMKERAIIQAEYYKQECGKESFGFDPVNDVAEYVKMRADIKAKLGADFDKYYDSQRATDAKCARANLDNSNGKMYCYVLPRFNDDGTHDPWGPKDIPWNGYVNGKHYYDTK